MSEVEEVNEAVLEHQHNHRALLYSVRLTFTLCHSLIKENRTGYLQQEIPEKQDREKDRELTEAEITVAQF